MKTGNKKLLWKKIEHHEFIGKECEKYDKMWRNDDNVQNLM